MGQQALSKWTFKGKIWSMGVVAFLVLSAMFIQEVWSFLYERGKWVEVFWFGRAIKDSLECLFALACLVFLAVGLTCGNA
jgi:hypothetical protein